jgi:hypothetical protein
MGKLRLVLASLGLIAVGATAQVRPVDCRPVFPVVDQVAAVLPQDVVTAQAAPAVAAHRGFVGIPWLIPGLFGAGLVAIVTTHHDHHDTVSPA